MEENFLVNQKIENMIGGAEGDRTPDLRIANATLSRLSYGPDLSYPYTPGGGTPGFRTALHRVRARW